MAAIASPTVAQQIQAGADAVQAQTAVLQIVASDVWAAIGIVQAIPVAAASAAAKKAAIDALLRLPVAINSACGSINVSLMAIQQANAGVYEWDARHAALNTGLASFVPRQAALLDRQKQMNADGAAMVSDFANLVAGSVFPK